MVEVKEFDISKLSYPDLVVLLMQVGIPWGFWDRADVQEAEIYALLLKSLSGETASVVESNSVLANLYNDSMEKHLFAVRNMLQENKDKFDGNVLPVATYKNAVVVLDSSMSLYKVSFDDNYNVNEVKRIGSIYESSISEEVNAISKKLLTESIFDKDRFISILNTNGNLLYEAYVVDFLKSLNKGLYNRWYENNRDRVKMLIGKVNTDISKTPEIRLGLKDLKVKLEELVERLNIPLNESKIDIGFPEYRLLVEDLKTELLDAVNVIDWVLSNGSAYAEQLYDALFNKYFSYLESVELFSKISKE
jgi:hypothetical protein